MSPSPAEKLVETVAANFLAYRSLNFELLVSICFLCDWKHLIEFDRQITEAKWTIEENRVRSRWFENVITGFDKLSVEGEVVRIVTANQKLECRFGLGTSERRVSDHVFSVIDRQADYAIMRIVLSTYPFNFSGELDLNQLARNYIDNFGREYLFSRTA